MTVLRVSNNFKDGRINVEQVVRARQIFKEWGANASGFSLRIIPFSSPACNAKIGLVARTWRWPGCANACPMFCWQVTCTPTRSKAVGASTREPTSVQARRDTPRQSDAGNGWSFKVLGIEEHERSPGIALFMYE